MSIVSSEIIIYGSANMQDTDSGTQGGAIDTTTRVVFTDISAADTVEVLSDNAGDTTQTVTVTGRLATGVITTDVLSLNGTTVVNGVVTFERILKVVISASHAGTVTLRKASDNVTIVAIETGVLTIRRPFYNAVANATGGASKDYYEKCFIKNTHGTLSLLNAAVVESSDATESVGADVTFDLESAVGGSNTSTNRLTAPSGGGMLGSFTDASKNVPGTNLAAGASIGCWLKLTLPAGTATQGNAIFVLNTSGSST